MYIFIINKSLTVYKHYYLILIVTQTIFSNTLKTKISEQQTNCIYGTKIRINKVGRTHPKKQNI